MTRVVAVSLLTLAILGFIQNNRNAFAETVEVEILNGATTLADRSYSPNPVQITVGDTIKFVNNDNALHTATSGNGGSVPQPSNVFDSGYIGPNKEAEVTINEVGEFPYYCQLHPTMVGLVKVSSKPTGDGIQFKVITTFEDKTYEVTGQSSTNAKATAVAINANSSVMVNFEGSGDIELNLPIDMIEGISNITSADGRNIEFAKTSETDSLTTIKFNIPDGAESIQIMGAKVVPEFPIVAAAILVGSLVAVITIVRIMRGLIPRLAI